jgi:hypothetical protein
MGFGQEGDWNVIFMSHDVVEGLERETEIRPAGPADAREFSLSWDPYVDEKVVTDRDFDYRIFEWDMLIHLSLTGEFDYLCYAAVAEGRLEGLLALRREKILYIDFVSTAPWNYGRGGRLRRIGSGLIHFTIQSSLEAGQGGAFNLFAVLDAEAYFEKIGMVPTGRFKYGLREYTLPAERAVAMADRFHVHVVTASLGSEGGAVKGRRQVGRVS